MYPVVEPVAPTMASRVYRATVAALYQLSLLVGIALLPFALATRRLGLSLPFHRLVTRLRDAHERAGSSP